ncbi:MAG: hypothetical protein NBV61_08125 [Algoriphagus sp.]|nr:hypothetical protein [Algoriphagus sp.]
MNENLKYEKRIIAFIDILGFRELIKDSEKNPATLEKIYEVINYFKNWEKPESWNLKTIEIEEDAQKKGLANFDLSNKSSCTCFSDSIIVSIKICDGDINALLSTLIANISYIGSYIIQKGILFRGAITIGNIIHQDNGIILGQGFIDAYNLESKLATFPRIVVSDKLIKELNYPLEAKRNRYPYHQYLTRDKDGCIGFNQLKYFEVVQSWTEMKEEILKDALDKTRKVIIDGLDYSFELPSVHSKYQWLKNEYNSLIILTDNIKQPIKELNENIAGQNIHFSYTDNYYFGKK